MSSQPRQQRLPGLAPEPPPRRHSPIRDQLPEAGRLWIRFRPRGWRSAPGLWIDPAAGRLGGSDQPAAVPGSLLDVLLEDVLYLPPVAAEDRELRDRVAVAHLSRGTPVLAQLLPGDPLPPGGARVALDLLAWRLDRRPPPERPELNGVDLVLWPLLAGIGGDEDDWREWGHRLAVGGVAVHPAPVELSPDQTRALVERGGEDLFEPLFHRPPPDDRVLQRVMASCGAPPPWDRPVGSAARFPGNARVAGALLLAGELVLRLGEAESRAHALFRAGRWVDRASWEITTLVRDDILGAVEELAGEAGEAVRALASGARWGGLEELQQRFLAG